MVSIFPKVSAEMKFIYLSNEINTIRRMWCSVFPMSIMTDRLCLLNSLHYTPEICGMFRDF